MKFRHFILSALWIICGTILFLNEYVYEAGTTCFWLIIATLTWPSVQSYTHGRAWKMLAWFHIRLVPVFFLAHILACHFEFWTYQSKYLVVIPQSIPLLGGIPLFEFIFYSIYTAAVMGLYSWAETIYCRELDKDVYLQFTRIIVLVIVMVTILLILLKPNPYLSEFPYWFCIMFASSIPFMLALFGIPPLKNSLSFVLQTCKRKAFIAFCFLLLPLLAFWELSAIKHGVWVYNRSMTLSSVVMLAPDGLRFWPIDLFYGHINSAIIVFLILFFMNKTNEATTKI